MEVYLNSSKAKLCLLNYKKPKKKQNLKKWNLQVWLGLSVQKKEELPKKNHREMNSVALSVTKALKKEITS